MPVYIYLNAHCLKCKRVLASMLRVGAFIMCPKCFHKEFDSIDPQKDEREKYRNWLKKYFEEDSE